MHWSAGGTAINGMMSPFSPFVETDDGAGKETAEPAIASKYIRLMKCKDGGLPQKALARFWGENEQRVGLMRKCVNM